MNKYGFQYSLIITDFNMPEMNGIEATKAIRQFLTKENQFPKIVGITGHANKEFHLEGIKAGMDKVESKPCKFETINDFI